MSSIWTDDIDDYSAWVGTTETASDRTVESRDPPPAPKKRAANGKSKAKQKAAPVTGPTTISTTRIGGGEGSGSRPTYTLGRDIASRTHSYAPPPQQTFAGQAPHPGNDVQQSRPSRTFLTVPEGLKQGHRQASSSSSHQDNEQGSAGLGERSPRQPAHLICQKTPGGQAQIAFKPVASASRSTAARQAQPWQPPSTPLAPPAEYAPQRLQRPFHPTTVSRPRTAASSSSASPFRYDAFRDSSPQLEDHLLPLRRPDTSVYGGAPQHAYPMAQGSMHASNPRPHQAYETDEFEAQASQIFQSPYGRSPSVMGSPDMYGAYRQPFAPAQTNGHYSNGHHLPAFQARYGRDRREVLYDGVFNRDDQEETKRSKRSLSDRYSFGKGQKTWSTLSGQGRTKHGRGNARSTPDHLAHIDRTRVHNLPATPSLGAAAAGHSARSVGSVARTRPQRMPLRPPIAPYPSSTGTMGTPSRRAHTSSLQFSFTSPKRGETPPTPAFRNDRSQDFGRKSAISLISSESDCDDAL